MELHDPEPKLVPHEQYMNGLRRVENLSLWVALGGAVPTKRPLPDPVWSWAVFGRGYSA